MDKETLKQYLGGRYQGSASFLHNVILPIFGEDNFEDGYDTELLDIYPERRRLAQATGINSVRQVGSFYIGVEPLLIFDITVADRIMMERNRADIQRLVRAVMDQYSCAFMVFHYDHDERWDWRFTFCHRGDSADDFTDSHRYTFLLGPGQSCRTAADNFYNLYQNRAALEVKDIEQAFSIEALSKEFFGKYKAQYERFVAYVTGKAYVKSGGKYVERVVNPHNDKAMYAAFGHDDRRVRDYVKRLLGRIVFLHFLQKKGWLGLPEGAAWDSGLGNPDFMHELYLKASPEQQDDFLDRVLEPLFTAIDTDRSGQGDLYDTGVLGRVRVPYLNGGLFERDADDKIESRFPKDYFASLLDFFSQYNFTVDENDPNDAQVGIDPEMLSRIFENLLEDNKDKGAYYTPKEVVRHICRESLIAYLRTGDDRHGDAIRRFVLTLKPELIADIRDDIDRRLREVKICDPAIGSGAFPMGMLKEIFQCRYAIEEFGDAAQIKREIIQSNIYGVDIEQGAVEIARLRFWLSLVVDETTPETLPNLDFKIMQGNSLLEQYKGVDLSNITALKRVIHHDAGIKATLFDSEVDVLRKNMSDKLAEYFCCTDHSERAKLRKDIADIVQQELYAQSYNVSLDGIDIHANPLFFLWHTWFNDVFSRPSNQGVSGFDIVIGNPPYVSAPTQIDNPVLARQRQDIINSKRYLTLNEKWDLYIPFMELGLQLLAADGVFAMIVPYPLTNQKYGKKLRQLITEQTRILEIADLNGTKIFENATVSNCIPIVRKAAPAESLPIVHIDDNRQFHTAFVKPVAELVQDEKSYVWNLTEEQRQTNRFPKMNVLGDYCYISKGMVLNADEKTAKGEFSKDDLIRETQDALHPRQYIEAKDIDKYEVRRVRYLEWNTTRCPGQLSRPTFRELYEQPKLMFNRLGSLKVYLDTTIHFLHSDSMFSAVLWKDLRGIKNNSIAASVKRYSRKSRVEMERLSESISLYYLLAVLNSKTADELLADQRGGDYHIYPEHIRNLPIAPATTEEQRRIGLLARQVLEGKAAGQDTSALESQIDDEVAHLYAE